MSCVRTTAQATPAAKVSSRPLLQRKCACGHPHTASFETGCAMCGDAARVRGQTKLNRLTVGAPDDAFEREADQVAQQVIGGEPASTRSDAPARRLQRLPAAGPEAASAPSEAQQALNTPGRPLDRATRSFFEPRFDRDFSSVRIHTDGAADRSARAVNARAYTVGRQIVFAAGEYAPHTSTGRHLLAHELAHVIQQDAGPNRSIQRAPGPAGETAPPVAGKEEGDKTEGTAAVGGRVIRIVIATEDGVLTVETPSTDYLYELDQWDIPQGSHKASVTVKGKDVIFDFGKDFADRLFHFSYRINKGQDNPATLLKGQKDVTVDVVPTNPISPEAKPIKCLLPIENQILIKEYKSSTPLFPSVTKNTEWFIGKVPLGFLGWIDVNAKAGLSLAGLLSYGWGPGVLRDICLYRTLDGDRLGGSATFKFGAALSPSVSAKGKLEAVASYVGVVDVVSARLDLDASAIGRLSGKIDGRVDLSYDRRKNEWGFDAEAMITGSAGMKLKATAAAAIEILWKEVWSKQWKLIDADFHIGWTGGVRIGTDTRPQFIFGRVGILSDQGGGADPGGPQLATATAPDPLATEAEFDHQEVMEASINTDTGDPARTPEGLSLNDPLPIIWYKPLNIYPKNIDIPRAIRPERLDRDDGPTLVEYEVGRGRTARDLIGVGEDDTTGQTNWPLPVGTAQSRGKTFSFVEKTAGDTVKNRLRDRFNDRLLPAGTRLSSNGWDVDHVHEKQFGGQDALSNLWPADSGPNRDAGDLHNEQLNMYRGTIGSIAGRWFEIVDVRYP